MSLPRGVVPFPGRTVSRGRGCWNCIHFENGILARQKYRAARAAEFHAIGKSRMSAGIRDQSLLDAIRLAQRSGMAPGAAAETVLAQAVVANEKARYSQFDRMVANGSIGMCLKGKPSADFVESAYLCNGWTGRQGASVATAGHALDKLPEELREELDGPTEKKKP